MPYYFNYYEPNTGEKIFHKKLLTGRCNGISNTGTRCKRKCIIGFEYCYNHLIKIKKLRIKDSTIPNAGKGLFCYDPSQPYNAIIFRPNDTVIEYKGEHLTLRQLEDRYEGNNAPYTVRVKQDDYIDSAVNRGVGSLANHKAVSYTNARLSSNYTNSTVSIKATKNIRNNQEIFVNYGDEYIFDNNYNTKPYKTKN
jgi:hypothetical protein